MPSLLDRLKGIAKKREHAEHADGSNGSKPRSTGMRPGVSTPAPASSSPASKPKLATAVKSSVDLRSPTAETLGRNNANKSTDAFHRDGTSPRSPTSPTFSTFSSTATPPRLDLPASFSLTSPRPSTSTVRPGDFRTGSIAEQQAEEAVDEFGSLALFGEEANVRTLSEDELAERRVSVQDAEISVKAASTVIRQQGIETLGVFHPHWFSASRPAQIELISRYLSLLSSSAPSSASLERFRTALEDAQPTDVGALLKWTLRHLQASSSPSLFPSPSSSSSLTLEDQYKWYTTFASSERNANFPSNAYSSILLPLVPSPINRTVLGILLDLAGAVAAHAGGNGMFNTRLVRALAWWVVGARVWPSLREGEEGEWRPFYDAWSRAAGVLEHVFLAYLRDQDQRRLPVRLVELGKPYPPTLPSSSEGMGIGLPPKPRLGSRRVRALFVRLEAPFGTPRGRGERDAPGKLLDEALVARIEYASSEAEDGWPHALWLEVRKDVSDTAAKQSGAGVTIGEEDENENENEMLASLRPHTTPPAYSILSETTIHLLSLLSPPTPSPPSAASLSSPTRANGNSNGTSKPKRPEYKDSTNTTPLITPSERFTRRGRGELSFKDDGPLPSSSPAPVGLGIQPSSDSEDAATATAPDYLRTFSSTGFAPSKTLAESLGASLATPSSSPPSTNANAKTPSRASSTAKKGGRGRSMSPGRRALVGSPLKRKTTTAGTGNGNGHPRPSIDTTAGAESPRGMGEYLLVSTSTTHLPAGASPTTADVHTVTIPSTPLTPLPGSSSASSFPPVRIAVPPTSVELDEAFVDTWADTLLDQNVTLQPKRWPDFGVYGLKEPRGGEGEKVEFIVVERYVASHPPPPPTPPPAAPVPAPAPEASNDAELGVLPPAQPRTKDHTTKAAKRSISPSRMNSSPSTATARGKNRFSHFFGNLLSTSSSSASVPTRSSEVPHDVPLPASPPITRQGTEAVAVIPEEEHSHSSEVVASAPSPVDDTYAPTPPLPLSTDPVAFPAVGGSSLADSNDLGTLVTPTGTEPSSAVEGFVNPLPSPLVEAGEEERGVGGVKRKPVPVVEEGEEEEGIKNDETPDVDAALPAEKAIEVPPVSVQSVLVSAPEAAPAALESKASPAPILDDAPAPVEDKPVLSVTPIAQPEPAAPESGLEKNDFPETLVIPTKEEPPTPPAANPPAPIEEPIEIPPASVVAPLTAESKPASSIAEPPAPVESKPAPSSIGRAAGVAALGGGGVAAAIAMFESKKSLEREREPVPTPIALAPKTEPEPALVVEEPVVKADDAVVEASEPSIDVAAPETIAEAPVPVQEEVSAPPVVDEPPTTVEPEIQAEESAVEDEAVPEPALEAAAALPVEQVVVQPSVVEEAAPIPSEAEAPTEPGVAPEAVEEPESAPAVLAETVLVPAANAELVDAPSEEISAVPEVQPEPASSEVPVDAEPLVPELEAEATDNVEEPFVPAPILAVAEEAPVVAEAEPEVSVEIAAPEEAVEPESKQVITPEPESAVVDATPSTPTSPEPVLADVVPEPVQEESVAALEPEAPASASPAAPASTLEAVNAVPTPTDAVSEPEVPIESSNEPAPAATDDAPILEVVPLVESLPIEPLEPEAEVSPVVADKAEPEVVEPALKEPAAAVLEPELETEEMSSETATNFPIVPIIAAEPVESELVAEQESASAEPAVENAPAPTTVATPGPGPEPEMQPEAPAAPATVDEEPVAVAEPEHEEISPEITSSFPIVPLIPAEPVEPESVVEPEQEPVAEPVIESAPALADVVTPEPVAETQPESLASSVPVEEITPAVIEAVDEPEVEGPSQEEAPAAVVDASQPEPAVPVLSIPEPELAVQEPLAPEAPAIEAEAESKPATPTVEEPVEEDVVEAPTPTPTLPEPAIPTLLSTPTTTTVPQSPGEPSPSIQEIPRPSSLFIANENVPLSPIEPQVEEPELVGSTRSGDVELPKDGEVDEAVGDVPAEENVHVAEVEEHVEPLEVEHPMSPLIEAAPALEVPAPASNVEIEEPVHEQKVAELEEKVEEPAVEELGTVSEPEPAISESEPAVTEPAPVAIAPSIAVPDEELAPAPAHIEESAPEEPIAPEIQVSEPPHVAVAEEKPSSSHLTPLVPALASDNAKRPDVEPQSAITAVEPQSAITASGGSTVIGESSPIESVASPLERVEEEHPSEGIEEVGVKKEEERHVVHDEAPEPTQVEEKISTAASEEDSPST